MSETHHEQLMQILSEVMETPEDQRLRLLDHSCGGNAALRAEVEELLRCERRAARLFDDGAVALSRIAVPAEIGPYRLLEQIGEGGMGSVYRAEQRVPIRRIVAVKIIKLGMDTREVIARFELERQALAVLDHPHVAKVLDAGATAAGRPYFVMEYVPGEPITTVADRYKLTVRQRLELFTQVCEAVQHAHQKAIIHRDLKPSNILVTRDDGKLWIKVIDFGVAKATGERLTERTRFTASGQMVGTPEYMAPEQAGRPDSGGQDVDTRSDVYSLGVVLYELLTGAAPFDTGLLRSSSYDEVQRIIRDTDPPRPSTRLSGLGKRAGEVAGLRQTSLDALERQLQGELEWIPLKAMRKDRDHRYSTAAELAEDIANYLSDRPLRAGPESAAYRARTFVRRNKRVVAASAVMLTLLVAGIAGTTWQAVRATRAQRQTSAALKEVQQQTRQANEANQALSAVNDFLTNGVIGASDPQVTRGKPLTVLDALDNAARTIGDRLPDSARSKSAIEVAIAKSYRALGRADLAMPHARTAAELCARSLQPDDLPTLLAHAELATVLEAQGKLGEAEPLLQDALDRARRRYGPADEQTLDMSQLMANLRLRQGRLAEAETLGREAIDGIRKLHGSDHQDTLESLNVMALILRGQGKLPEAERLLSQAVQASTRALGEDHPDTLYAMGSLAAVMQAQGKLADAEPLKRDVLTKARRVLGEDHPFTINSTQNFADLLARLGKVDEADALFREALEKGRRLYGPDDHLVLAIANNYARLLDGQGKFDQAEPLYRQAVELGRMARGIGHPDVLVSVLNYARALSAHGRRDEAESMEREALQVAREKLGPDHRLSMVFMQDLGQNLEKQGKLAEAEALLRESLRRRRAVLGDDNSETVDCLAALDQFLLRQGRVADAEPVTAELHRRSPAAKPAATQAVSSRPVSTAPVPQ